MDVALVLHTCTITYYGRASRACSLMTAMPFSQSSSLFDYNYLHGFDSNDYGNYFCTSLRMLTEISPVSRKPRFLQRIVDTM